MKQTSFLDIPDCDNVVNVASIKQRSPFRYPGGKTWLIPRIRAWFSSMKDQPEHFVEVFAGGGIVALTVAAENLARHVTMIEIDHQVAAVWKTILCDAGGGEWLAQHILDFQISLEAVQEVVHRTPKSTRELAFQTIVKNRAYHGGILAPGSAPLKQGENGKGVASRWYASTLARRIHEIIAYRSRITFLEGDGIEYLNAHAEEQHTAYFIDPPYTGGNKRAGSRLYVHWQIDHYGLFDLTARLAGPFLMTYDNDQAITELAEHHGFEFARVAMTNTHHANMRELLISRDVSWV
jgi:DNA adenine methylase